MKLMSVLEGVNYQLLAGDLNQEIEAITYDSRKVRPGSLFVCIKGFKTDGHRYIEQAINNGAVALIVEDQELKWSGATVVYTSNTRQALSKLAANYYGDPSRELRLIGVTGTNGKTTITHLIKAILEEAGKKVGIIGTLYAKIGDKEEDLKHTTPEAPEVEAFISQALQEQADYLVMEVSSHALDLERVTNLHFKGAIFSNLSQEHLDYHQDMETYRAAKLKLFNMINNSSTSFSIVNLDDSNAEHFMAAAPRKALTYGVNQLADVKALNLDVSLKGTSFLVKYKDDKEFKIKTKLIGLFNVYNILAAIALALNEGIDSKTIKKALEKVEGVPGRFEQIDCGQEFTVIVDYAHTPDGLENILKTAKEIVENRLITVFGCGGDRDRSKRPLMGNMAANYSDFCVVTSDNPRTEDPKKIIDDIIPGLDAVATSRYAVIMDRKEAIRHAINLARPGDVVIIAGKGHETYQLIGDKVLDFDDRQVAKEILRGHV